MRVLGIDPGEKNIGIAISDPTGTIARPYLILRHTSRQEDAVAIARLAEEAGAGAIVVGQATDSEGRPTVSGRQASRLAAAIRAHTRVPVYLWDESHSTQTARAARIAVGARRKKRRGHLDDQAAAVILQSYLDATPPPEDSFTPVP